MSEPATDSAAVLAPPAAAPVARPARTLIEEHRGLLAIFGARGLGWAAAFAVALLVALVWIGSRAGVRARVAAVLVATGAVYWSFIEYALHRWFYHWRPRPLGLRRFVESFHVYHHRTPGDRSVWNAGPALVVPLTVALSLPPLLILRDVALTAVLMIGAVVAYLLYEAAHHECHARVYRRGPMAYMQAFHLHHHNRDWRRNFGVTNPFWDWVFGTLASPEDGR